jgi:HAD superfamily hydrolase (TIGR01509 family)
MVSFCIVMFTTLYMASIFSVDTTIKYKNIIFDVGGVLLDGDAKTFAKQLKQAKSYAEHHLLAAAKSKAWQDWDKGLITKQQLIASLEKQFSKTNFEAFLSLFLAPERPLIQESIAVIGKLKERNYKLYILSNFSKDAYSAFITYHSVLLKQFDGTLFSFEVACTKPSPKIYQLLLDKYHLNAYECLFIDDSEDNVQEAQNQGIKGIKYQKGQLLTMLYNLDILEKETLFNENKHEVCYPL